MSEIFDAKQDQSEKEDSKPKLLEKNEFQQYLVNELIKNHHFITLSDTEEIYYYENGVYKPDGESIIEIETEKLNPEVSNHWIKETLGHISRRTRKDRSVFDSHSDFLNVKNCMYDIKNNKPVPHSPGFHSNIQYPVKYDSKATCPEIIKFLKSTLRPEGVKAIITLASLAIWRNTSFQIAGILVGSGNNGKGTFLKMLEALIGKENVCSISPQNISDNKYASAGLYGKVVNLVGDISSKPIGDSSTFKMIIGNDTISAENKFKPRFEFEPRLILIFSANELPDTLDKTFGFFRRLVVIPFPYNFEGREDRELISKLTTEKELSGFLNILLRNIWWIRRTGKISIKQTVDQKRTSYENNLDPIELFLSECLDIATTNDMVTKDDMYKDYVDFCNTKDLAVETKEVFGRKIKEKGYKTTRTTIDGKRVYAWFQCKLKFPSMST